MKKNFTLASRRRDRIAEWLIKIGGVLVIVSVVWILVMIAQVALPLFFPPGATAVAAPQLASQTGQPLALGIDETRQRVFTIDQEGTLHIIDTATGAVVESMRVPGAPAPGHKVVSIDRNGSSTCNLLWDNGAVTSLAVSFGYERKGDHSTAVSHTIAENTEMSFPPQTPVPQRSFVRAIEGKGVVRVDLTPHGVLVTHRVVEKDFLGNEKVNNSRVELKDAAPAPISAAAVDQKGHYLYAGTERGELLRWDIAEAGQARLVETVNVTADKRPVTALTLVQGGISVAIGDSSGAVSTWFPVRTSGSGDDKSLTRIHPLRPHAAAITGIIASPRDKSLVSADDRGTIHIDHTTAERSLLTLRVAQSAAMMALSPQGHALCVLDKAGKLHVWKLDIPHPDVSFGTLFRKVWYEGYERPEFVWQSSAATDDYEPKMSLVPLVFGTIKATLFAMLFAVPLALFGALYTSQFMSPTLKGRVKPVVEIMAAIPSVVVGFLAGLWLAPLIDQVVLAFFTSIVLIPLMLLVTIIFWRQIKPYSKLGRMLRGNEFALLVPVVLIGICLSYLLGGVVETYCFGGDFKQWLFSTMGIRYDQRNSMIIAIALGFAVIPIIFTIAEDALSNVPRNLSAASLALGASRWQTAWRVVLPSALPGVFSAVMIGFGRAVGETMIVLMATGNTPIMSWSVFNGLRSLSANIAVEIPEAPLNSSLYRTLFLSAVLLFVFTFIINTAAEALRQRFRKKYGRY
ncbi:ABC transporter permease subunit [Geobacter sp. SVR]|uniref:ABC transporter permease subunit n=1 Tax=Geobacter sp. SVR TaxID=2495594 RepID=UPI00143EFD59|nr:ABC transporter permease subunit [Geobacter sp. SVR]GCF84688.1 phosphate ABC transporter permease [Geobacter sp. SVR]